MKPVSALGRRCATCQHRSLQHRAIFIPGKGHVKRGACDVRGCPCTHFQRRGDARPAR